jgi:hypothetical protein
LPGRQRLLAAFFFFRGKAMNFKFKLSRRLAIALVFTLGCGMSTSPVIVRIEGIDVSPARVALMPSQAVPLTVTLTPSRGDSIPIGDLQWSTTGGTIMNNGLSGHVIYITYQAPATAGTYLLIVTTNTANTADTASIAVTVAASPVSQVAVSPASASLATNDTTTLHVTLTDASGAVVVGRPITWTSSDQGVATVLATGFVRAVAAGTVTITASTEEHTGSATITVNP